ncbi:MAG: HAD family hydrolase [Spirochaetes bacterium]|nr:HAD family hydrolase [Spirochaetota bacterium]
MYIAFFDLDHTILSTSSGRVMFKGSYEHGIIGKKEVRRGILINILYRLGIISPHDAVSRWMKWYAGISVETIAPIAAEWIHELKGMVREGARKEIDRHREKGGRTVILSASPTFICEEMRKHLAMDDILCTELEVVDGLLTGNLKGNYCHGPCKLDRAIQYCSDYGFDLKEAYYYADSFADLPVLEAVGNPVCVTPDGKLERVARRRGWRIARW